MTSITGNEPALSNKQRVDKFSRRTLADLRSDVAVMRQMIPSWSECGRYDDDPFFAHTIRLLRYADILESLCDVSDCTKAYWRCYWCGCIGSEIVSESPSNDWVIDAHQDRNEHMRSMAFCSTEHRDEMWALQGWEIREEIDS